MNKKEEERQQRILTTAHFDYEKKLNMYAFFKVHDSSIGEDMVQDTFLKTWAYIAKGGKIEIMKAFLFHILNNLIVDEYRKHKTTSLDTLMEKGLTPSVDNSDSLFNIFDGKGALILIQRLPEKYRKVMRMKYVQGLSLEEMSILIGQSKNSIAVQLHRGLIKLKILYGKAGHV